MKTLKVSCRSNFKILLLVLAICFTSVNLYAQGRIKGFKSEIEKGEDGRVRVIIKPDLYAPGEPKNTKMYKVWGALICYRLNGKPKVRRPDLTNEIMTKGEYDTFLNQSKNSRITDISIEYFDATQPSSTYPPKDSCFK